MYACVCTKGKPYALTRIINSQKPAPMRCFGDADRLNISSTCKTSGFTVCKSVVDCLTKNVTSTATLI